MNNFERNIILHSSKKGLTLTELLVATTLIGIVMVGVAGYSINTQQLHRSGGRANNLAILMTAVMKSIEQDAIKAIGDATDSGIRTREQIAQGKRKICFRHDVADTPDNYNDDDWVCYCHDNSNVLRRRTQNNPPNNANCPVGAGSLRLLTLNQVDFYNVVPDDVSPQYVDITISSASDGSINPANCHPINNPCKTMTTRVVPMAHSSG